MYKVKFSLVRTVELQSWQEFELTDEQMKDFEKLEYDDEKYSYLSNLNKIDYGKEGEDDVLEVEIQDLKIKKIRSKKCKNLLMK